jgi:predicted small lipoprotein YifL
VIQSPRQTLLRIAAVSALVGALGLAGCGRKSGLDLPPAAAVDTTAAVQPGSEPGSGPEGRAVSPQGPKRRTPLDWLID